MATQNDNDQKPRSGTVPAKGITVERDDTKPGGGKDPDVYDPVGMAGKKAGIVQEIEQQLEQDDTNASQEGAITPKNGDGTAATSSTKHE